MSSYRLTLVPVLVIFHDTPTVHDKRSGCRASHGTTQRGSPLSSASSRPPRQVSRPSGGIAVGVPASIGATSRTVTDSDAEPADDLAARLFVTHLRQGSPVRIGTHFLIRQETNSHECAERIVRKRAMATTLEGEVAFPDMSRKAERLTAFLLSSWTLTTKRAGVPKLALRLLCAVVTVAHSIVLVDALDRRVHGSSS